MSNDYTKKHAEMYAGNLKTEVLLIPAEVANGKSYVLVPVSKKITVKAARYCNGNTAGQDTAHSVVTLYKGTRTAIAAASAAANLTGLTSVATKTLGAAQIAKSTCYDLTMTATLADRNVDGSDTGDEGLCFYITSPGATDKVPAGQLVVEYVDRDEA